MSRFTLILLGTIIVFSSYNCSQSNKQTSEDNQGFVIKKGLNASHWLSQSKKRGEERSTYMTEEDFAIIAEMGFDHVRLPIDEMHMWDEEGNRIDEAFELMHKGIQASIDNGMRVIVDLHVLRSHHFNAANGDGEGANNLFESAEAQQDFIKYWVELSGELKQYSNSLVAYEPMNEAVADNHEDWNKLINWVISEIRKLEPERTIIMGSNMWQQTSTFPHLRVPEGDSNIILSFHFYTPMPFSHYKASWTPMKAYEGPVNYPGLIVDTNDLAGLDETTNDAIMRYYAVYNKESMANDMLPAITKAKELGLKLFCGEFGLFPTTPMEMREQWYSDMIEIFEENDIAWSHWNYKNDFPVVHEDLTPISEIVDIMVPAE